MLWFGEAMKASRVLQRYAAGERNFQGANLRGLSFKGKDLSGADFSGADIRGTNFSRANLTGAKFRGAKAGLQKRWFIALLIVSWLLSGISGFCSLFVGVFVALIVTKERNDMFAGWISLFILIIFFLIAIRKGINFGAISGAVGGATAGAIVVALTVRDAVAGSGEVARAVAGSVAVAVAFVGAVAGVVTGGVAGSGAGAFTLAGAMASDIAGVVAGVFAFAFVGVFAGEVNGTVALIVAWAIISLGVYLGRRAMKGSSRDIWIRSAAIAFAATGGTSFYNATLTDADFRQARLASTDLREAILTRTCWRNTEKFDRIRPGNTLLKHSQVRELLKTGNGYGKSFPKADLRGANLQGANLEKADLKQADLSEAILRDTNLKDANLTETLAIETDFTGTYLTGACIEAWNIDPTTILDRVDCQYVYLLEDSNARGSRERRPHNPDRTFEPGDFEKLYKQVMHTVQLLLKNGVNPEAFREAFQQVMSENPEITWNSIQKVEQKEEDVLIEVAVPASTDKAEIERKFWTEYQSQLEAMEARYRNELNAKDREIEIYKKQNTDMTDIVKLLANRPINVETHQNNRNTTVNSDTIEGSGYTEGNTTHQSNPNP